MIRVALMLPKLGRYGGAEQFGYRLAAHLASHPSQDFQVSFICAKQDGPAPDKVRVIRVGRPVPGKLGKTLWFALAAEYVRRKEKFDVSLGLGNTIWQDMLRLSGGPTGLFWAYSLNAYEPGPERVTKALTRFFSPGKQLARLIEYMQARHTPVLVANSHFVRDITVQAFSWLDPARIRVIYNQPDLTRFVPATGDGKAACRAMFALPEEARLILTAGTNFRLKGIPVLIHALSMLPESFHLAVAGGRGSSQITLLARSLGLDTRVHFLGRVDDMPGLYQAADMFVLNSFYDACANAVLEALACGLPTLSTTCNGSSVFLRPEAVLDDPANALELARRIEALYGCGPTSRPDFNPEQGLEPYVECIRSLA